MKAIIPLALAAMLAACTTTSPDVIQRGDANRLSSVQDAVVLNVRPVVVDGTQSGVGGAAGAVVGVIGAVVGAVVGNAIERSTTSEAAVEIMVQLRNGERRAIVQAQGGEVFQPGDQVVLVSTGATTRVVRAQSVQPRS